MPKNYMKTLIKTTVQITTSNGLNLDNYVSSPNTEEESIVECEITATPEGLIKLKSEITGILESCGYSKDPSDTLFKKTPTHPLYLEGYAAVFTDKSIKLCVHTKEMGMLADTISTMDQDTCNISLNLSAIWPILNKNELVTMLEKYKQVVTAQLFSYYCKQVRNRGGSRNEEATFLLINVNYEHLLQGLLGTPLNSICKRSINYLGVEHKEYREQINKYYNNSHEQMIGDGVILQISSKEITNPIRPATIQEIEKYDDNKQKLIASNYNLDELR